VREKVEIEPWIVLEFERSLVAISQAANYDERGHKPDYLEVLPKLLRVPYLAVLSFQGFPTPRLGVNLDQSFTADRFGWVDHDFSPFAAHHSGVFHSDLFAGNAMPP
jgi:hypothetical protein